MGRLKREQEQLFYSFCLSKAVPDDHPVRGLAAIILVLSLVVRIARPLGLDTEAARRSTASRRMWAPTPRQLSQRRTTICKHGQYREG
jgi:hypothetical protein